MSYDLGPADPDDDGGLGYADEYEDEKPRRRILRPILVVLALVLCAWGIWHFAGNGRGRSPGEVPLIRADDSATKERPQQPGGMTIPNQDKLVYGDGQGQPKVEKLLPPPESPLPSPQPQAPPTPPPSQTTAAVAPSAPPGAPQSVQSTPAAPPVPPAPAPVAPAPVAAAPPPPPVAAPVAAAPAPSAPSTAAPSGSYRLQLAALRSEEAAKREWEHVKGANKDLLGRYSAAWPRANLGSRGIFYRVQVGPIADEASAERICGELKRRNVGCILVRP